METVGLLLVSLIFLVQGVNHLRNHVTLAGYAATAFGKCPIALELGYLGGWPTGVALIGAGVAVALNATLIPAIVFLVATQVLFHRDLKDVNNQKHLALLGALVALLAHA